MNYNIIEQPGFYRYTRHNIQYRHRNTYWMFSNWALGWWRALHWFNIKFLWSIKPSYREKLHVIFLSFHQPPTQYSSLFNWRISFRCWYSENLITQLMILWKRSGWELSDLQDVPPTFKLESSLHRHDHLLLYIFALFRVTSITSAFVRIKRSYICKILLCGVGKTLHLQQNGVHEQQKWW